MRYPDRGQFGETAGLYDAGARLYAPTWGQFLEGDPVLPEADGPESWGRYAYGGGDTVGRWDPDGRCAVPGAIVGGLLGGAVALFTGEDWRGVLAGAAAGAASGATCGLGFFGQVGLGAVVGAAHGTASAAIHGGNLAVGALRGGLGGALGGAFGFQLGRAAGALGQDLAGVSGFAGRVALNYTGDVAADLGVQGALQAVGLQDGVSLRDALVSGLTGTAGRAAHFARGAYRGWRGRGGRFVNMGAVLGVGLPVPVASPAARPLTALERNRMNGWLTYQDNGYEGFKTFEEWDAAGQAGAAKIQPFVDRAVAEVLGDPGLAERQRFLSANEANAIRALDAVLKPLGVPNWLNRVFFGKAVERYVWAAVAADPALRTQFRYRGGAYQPDFIGLGANAGLNFEVTTHAQIKSHLRRRGYGAGLNIAAYAYPREFGGF